MEDNNQHYFTQLYFVPCITKTKKNKIEDIKVIGKVRQLGDKNDQFQHNRASTINANFKNEITGTQTSFSTNFGGNFLFLERLD